MSEITEAPEGEQENLEEDDELYASLSGTKSLSPVSAAKGEIDDEDNVYHKIEFIHDVPLKLSVEIGQTQLTVREILALKLGSIIEFTKAGRRV